MSTPTKYTQFYKIVLPIVLVLVNFVLRYLYLDWGDISGDEPFSVFVSQQEISEINHLLKGENNPPIHFYLLHYWINWFGISALSVRMPSLIFSALTVGLIYRIGLKYLNLRIAIFASLVFTLSNFQIYFAHEARVYSLFTLLTCVSFDLFLGLFKSPSKWKWIALLLVNVLLLYAHFFGVFVLYVQGVAVLFIPEMRTKQFKPFLVVSLLSVMAYLPYLSIIQSRFGATSKSNWVPFPELADLYNVLWVFTNAPVIAVSLIGIAVVGFVVYLIRKKQIILHHKWTFVLWFLVPYLTMFLISLKMPIFLDRYLLFTSIGFYFSVGIAMDVIFKDAMRHGFAILGAMIGVGMMTTIDLKSGHDREASEIAEQVKSWVDQETSVILLPEWSKLQLMYHYDIDIFCSPNTFDTRLAEMSFYPCLKLSDLNSEWQKDRVVLVDAGSNLTDPEKSSWMLLEASYHLVKKIENYHHTIVYVYEHN